MKKISTFLTICIVTALYCSSCNAISTTGSDPVERKMTVTGYCKCGECCGWRRTWYGRAVTKSTGKRKKIGITASGARAGKGTIAADTSIYPFGTIIYVKGYGYGRVEDRGGKIKGQHIDLYFSSHGKAIKWGKQDLVVKVWLPKTKTKK